MACLGDVINPAEVDPSAPVEDGHGNFNDSEIEMSANEVYAAKHFDDLDGLDDLNDNFDLDDMGIGDQTHAVGESGDVLSRAPSPTPPSPHSTDPYDDDIDDVCERDRLEVERTLADEEAERRELAQQERDENSEDEDEEMCLGNEHEEGLRDEDIESGTAPVEGIGSGDDRGCNDDMVSEAGSDEGEEIRCLSSELLPAPESEPEVPKALDCNDPKRTLALRRRVAGYNS